MSHTPDPEQVAVPGELVLTFTVDQLRESKNVLHFGCCAFFAVAWRLDRKNPRFATVVGSLFTYASDQGPSLRLPAPRCILGREPSWPARFPATLITVPDGDVCLWTADAVSSQTIRLAVPAVLPWVPAPVTYNLVNRRAF